MRMETVTTRKVSEKCNLSQLIFVRWHTKVFLSTYDGKLLSQYRICYIKRIEILLTLWRDYYHYHYRAN